MNIENVRSKILDQYKKPKNTSAYRSYKIKVNNMISNICDGDIAFNRFPFEVLTDEEIVMFITQILDSKNEDRQIVANLRYSGMKYDFSGILVKDEKTKKEMELLDEVISETKGKKISEFPKYKISREIEKNRFDIRMLHNKKEEVINELYQLNEKIIRLLYDEKKLYFCIGLDFRCFTYIEEYLKYVDEEVNELITFMIALNTSITNKAQVFKILKQVADQYSTCMDFQISRHMNQLKEQRFNKYVATDFSINIEEFTQSYLLYKTYSNMYEEEKFIKNLLRKEEEKEPYKFINNAYTVERHLHIADDMNELRNMILEGHNDFNFEKKYEQTCDFIMKCQYFGEGWISKDNFQDVKNFYREIFISRVKYPRLRKTAMKMVGDYLHTIDSAKDDVMPPEAHIFMRTKLIRGYYRENGILDIIQDKDEFQESFREALLKTLLVYTNWDTLEYIYTLNCKMLSKIRDIIFPNLIFHPIK
ncbi:hypothetical protein QTL86_06285 [Cellulosilyticum sp. ST5]|uniref:hypothetical protein n=1 Tax=Cellulosilyticum sp. ST5 TaxID=3055805 RepID=UPI0039777833